MDIKVTYSEGTAFRFGRGQVDHDPLGYIMDAYGSIKLRFLTAHEPDATLETGDIIVKVYAPNELVLRVEAPDGWLIDVPWTLINTASPDCCVRAAKAALKLISYNRSKLAAHRKAFGITQKALAEMTGVALGQIANYESGQRSISGASYNTLKKLADALRCKIDDLV